MPRPKRPKGPPRKKRTFPAEFKQEAVRLLQAREASGATLASVCRELDLSPEQLRQWERDLGGVTARPGLAGQESEADELRRLRREVAVLRQEREFLKKGSSGNLGMCP